MTGEKMQTVLTNGSTDVHDIFYVKSMLHESRGEVIRVYTISVLLMSEKGVGKSRTGSFSHTCFILHSTFTMAFRHSS